MHFGILKLVSVSFMCQKCLTEKTDLLAKMKDLHQFTSVCEVQQT